MKKGINAHLLISKLSFLFGLISIMTIFSPVANAGEVIMDDVFVNSDSVSIQAQDNNVKINGSKDAIFFNSANASNEVKAEFSATENKKVTVNGTVGGINSIQAINVTMKSNASDLNNAGVLQINRSLNANLPVNYFINSGWLRFTDDVALSGSGINNLSISENAGLDLRNGIASNVSLNTLTLQNSGTSLNLAMDMLNGKADTINASAVNGFNGSTIHLVSVNTSQEILPVSTVDLSQVIQQNGNPVSTVVYDTSAIEGKIIQDNVYRRMFSRDGNTLIYAPISTGYQGYNPAVFASSVALQGAFLSQVNSYSQAFGNVDMKMLLTREQRLALKYGNKFANVDESSPIVFSPTFLPETETGVWFRPFATFENVKLQNGPSVDNIMYGSYFGGDSPLIQLGESDWDAQLSLYAGYNGSHQTYDSNSIYQNGGTLGLTTALYRGNFFTALTGNIGMNVVDIKTLYGKNDMTMLTSGIASKTGYNWELFSGKFIVQPSWLMSYSFITPFRNYTNPAGVRINQESLNAIQLVPGVKLIANLPHGWQPYLSANMVWNLIDKAKVKANYANLPQTSVEPYFEYGVGLQKYIGERFTGFGQAMFRAGGRTGAAFSFGFRFVLGEFEKKTPRHYSAKSAELTKPEKKSIIVKNKNEKSTSNKVVAVKSKINTFKDKISTISFKNFINHNNVANVDNEKTKNVDLKRIEKSDKIQGENEISNKPKKTLAEIEAQKWVEYYEAMERINARKAEIAAQKAQQQKILEEKIALKEQKQLMKQAKKQARNTKISQSNLQKAEKKDSDKISKQLKEEKRAKIKSENLRIKELKQQATEEIKQKRINEKVKSKNAKLEKIAKQKSDKLEKIEIKNANKLALNQQKQEQKRLQIQQKSELAEAKQIEKLNQRQIKQNLEAERKAAIQQAKQTKKQEKANLLLKKQLQREEQQASKIKNSVKLGEPIVAKQISDKTEKKAVALDVLQVNAPKSLAEGISKTTSVLVGEFAALNQPKPQSILVIEDMQQQKIQDEEKAKIIYLHSKSAKAEIKVSEPKSQAIRLAAGTKSSSLNLHSVNTSSPQVDNDSSISKQVNLIGEKQALMMPKPKSVMISEQEELEKIQQIKNEQAIEKQAKIEAEKARKAKVAELENSKKVAEKARIAEEKMKAKLAIEAEKQAKQNAKNEIKIKNQKIAGERKKAQMENAEKLKQQKILQQKEKEQAEKIKKADAEVVKVEKERLSREATLQKELLKQQKQKEKAEKKAAIAKQKALLKAKKEQNKKVKKVGTKKPAKIKSETVDDVAKKMFSPVSTEAVKNDGKAVFQLKLGGNSAGPQTNSNVKVNSSMKNASTQSKIIITKPDSKGSRVIYPHAEDKFPMLEGVKGTVKPISQ